MNNIISVNEFKDRILDLRTREFGDFCEDLISVLYNMTSPSGVTYDRNSLDDEKIEVKGSIPIPKKKKDKNKETNPIKRLWKILLSSNKRGFIKFSEYSKYKWDCNIQQIKTSLFDCLYYLLFFDDFIYVFRVSKNGVPFITGYSPKQHRGNEGEGQFHITDKNLRYHLQNYLLDKFSYDNILDKLRNNE